MISEGQCGDWIRAKGRIVGKRFSVSDNHARKKFEIGKDY